jgi:putative nucleotidyltransferase with HDIG domain
MRVTLSELLRIAGFQVDTAGDAETACHMIEENDYDVVVTDIIMPKISGIELLARIRKISQTLQVVIMTGEPSVDTAIKAVQSGANDYLTKPINKETLLKTVRHAASIKLLSDQKAVLERENHLYQKELEETVDKRTKSLQNAMQGVIYLLSSVVEVRDPYTAGHQRRVGNLSAAIAENMRMDSRSVEFIRIIGYIHDIGKIAIPAEILSKPGKLTTLETEMIKNHCYTGYEMLSKVSLPDIIGQTVYQHHERFDGSGYPRGLKDYETTDEAKIIIVADVVEAMISHRPYRPALGMDAALAEIKQKSGTLYNPDVVRACVSLFENDLYFVEDDAHAITFPI